MGIIPDIDPRGPPVIPDWWDREDYEDEYNERITLQYSFL